VIVVRIVVVVAVFVRVVVVVVMLATVVDWYYGRVYDGTTYAVVSMVVVTVRVA